MPDAAVEHQVRPFADFLQEQRKGKAHAEMSEAMNELVAAVIQHGKGGSLTLTIKVKPAGAGGQTVFVGDSLTVKIPEGDKGEAIYFVDENSNLSRHDPFQARLPLRAAGEPESDDEEEAEAK